VNSYGNEAGLAEERYPSQAGNHYQENADFHKHFYAFEAPYDSTEDANLVESKLSNFKSRQVEKHKQKQKY